MSGLRRARAWLRGRAAYGGKLDDPDAPAFWRAYAKQVAEPIDADALVAETPFVILDTETTGLDLASDRIVSCACVRVLGPEIEVSAVVDWRVKASRPSSSASIEVHGLLNTELTEGLSEAAFLQRLTEYIGKDILVGYRLGFDMAMINRIARERVGGRVANRTLDVFDLGMRVDFPVKPPFVNPEPYRLERLCTRYGVDVLERHTALGDAYTTALLFVKLLYRLRTQGITTLGQLLRYYP